MSKAILSVKPIDFQWPALNPFLFAVHHNDYYPAGDSSFGPVESLEGRKIGNDFIPKNGWRMYHGSHVPGFPVHPHRGFETITITKQGFIDHADSMGASGRYGQGDVQWMTAGKGIQHAEMFPLLNADAPNTCELFQLWLNLPADKKMVDPHYKMLWQEQIPIVTNQDDTYSVRVIAGKWQHVEALPPTPESWAAISEHKVCIFDINLKAGAHLMIPTETAPVNRMLYFYNGESMIINGKTIREHAALHLDPAQEVKVSAGKTNVNLLLLQGIPINEPVQQYGPFVMNSMDEIEQAFNDFRNTQFGGWPWDRSDPVHGAEKKRFATYPDGSIEKPH